MSILLGTEIIEEYKNGKVIIDPFNEKHVGPNSVDVTLANTLVTYTPVEVKYQANVGYIVVPYVDPASTILDMAEKNQFYTIEIPEEGLIIQPNILYLGATNEACGSDYYVPMYEGRSSMARLGIQSHLSAGFGDIFFKSNWTLEITVVHPTRIYPNRRIGQVYFHNVHEDVRNSLIEAGKEYQGKYTSQPKPQISKSYMDFDN
jgi:dCTP deaminase